MFKNTNVRELTSSDFDDAGNLSELKFSKNKSLVLFYAEWCGHCANFKPNYMELSNKYNKANYYAFNMSSPDENTRNKMKRWKFQVSGFPTIVGFYNGQPYSVYNGDRSVRDIMEYVDNIGKKWNV
jgi:protein disulfide-isomerase